MTTIEMARRVVRRHLKLFEAGAFDGLDAVAQGPVKTDERGVMIIPAVDFLPIPYNCNQKEGQTRRRTLTTILEVRRPE